MEAQSSTFELSDTEFMDLLAAARPVLMSYARGLLPTWDLVDEAIQEASVTMWRKKHQLKNEEGFLPWARVVVKFKCLRQLEKLKKQRPLLSNELIDQLALRGEERTAEEITARGRALRLCLGHFSAEHRQLLLAPHSDNYKVTDLAKSLKKTPNALYKLLGRLREKLTDCIRMRTEVNEP